MVLCDWVIGDASVACGRYLLLVLNVTLMFNDAHLISSHRL